MIEERIIGRIASRELSAQEVDEVSGGQYLTTGNKLHTAVFPADGGPVTLDTKYADTVWD